MLVSLSLFILGLAKYTQIVSLQALPITLVFSRVLEHHGSLLNGKKTGFCSKWIENETVYRNLVKISSGLLTFKE